MKLVSFWGENTNPFYDPDKTANGGGYFQPCGGAVLELEDGRTVEVTYQDKSCGEFGSNLFMEVQSGAFGWKVWWDTMTGSADDQQEMADDFTAVANACLAADAIDLHEVYDLVRPAVETAAWRTIANTCSYFDRFEEGA